MKPRNQITQIEIACCALLFTIAACGHTKHVEAPAAATARDDSARADAPEAQLPTHEKMRSENGVPLATSPADLLEPQAAKAIQKRLGAAGLLPAEQATGHVDAATRDALARFQRAHDLPATGEPDNVTVRALGLDPGKIFQAGRKPEKDAAR